MQKSLATLPDLTPLFERYEALTHEADLMFAHVRGNHASCVACAAGCSDCCHSPFDVPLIEAVYLNHAFSRAFPPGEQRSALLNAADMADRAVRAIKRRASENWQNGREENAVLAGLARERVRCPLLNAEGRCWLYASRPMTCRVYGIPMSIDGTGYICGKSGFRSGNHYPAVDLGVLRARLTALSLDLVRHMQSGNEAAHTVLTPISSVLLTSYDLQYFATPGI